MKNTILNISICAVLGVMLLGCTKDFKEINTNPNAYATAPLTNILAYSIRYACDNMFDPWADMNEPSTYAGHLAKQQYIDEARYVFRATVVANNWHYLYITMNNLRDIQKKATEEGATNMVAAAQIWEAVIMQMGTDRWRDLPYSEACRIDEGILTPKYDKQEEIYPALMDLLKSAGASMGTAYDDLGQGDVLFGGNTTQWKQLANSLRLRMALRIANVNPSLAKQVAEEASKQPLIKTNADNAFFWWPDDPNYYEPWYDDSRTRNDHCCSDILINVLKELDDPRLPAYAHVNGYGEYQGCEIGGPNTITPGWQMNYSQIGSRFRDQATGFSAIYRAAETYFHLAEAAARGWNVGISAEEAYNKAVSLSCEENEVDAIAYLAGKAAYDGTLDQIYLQEWIALFKQGMEAWSLYRKTGIPTTHHIASYLDAAGYAGKGHNTPPLRYPYPVVEATLNGDNSEAARASVIDDFWGTPMWYDTRPGVK